MILRLKAIKLPSSWWIIDFPKRDASQWTASLGNETHEWIKWDYLCLSQCICVNPYYVFHRAFRTCWSHFTILRTSQVWSRDYGTIRIRLNSAVDTSKKDHNPFFGKIKSRNHRRQYPKKKWERVREMLSKKGRLSSWGSRWAKSGTQHGACDAMQNKRIHQNGEIVCLPSDVE